MRFERVHFDRGTKWIIAIAFIVSCDARAADIGVVAPSEKSAQGTGYARESQIDELVESGVRLKFAGDFDAADGVWEQIRKLDPSHPAAPIHAADTRIWRQMSAGIETRDPILSATIRRAIQLSRSRRKASPSDPMAHYYLGTALMQQARIELVSRNFFAAGSAGEKGRVELERALELRPDWVDAKYQLGLFYYYAGVLPDVLKWLDWLWFVPSGDMTVGLSYLDEVCRSGTIHRDDALFSLGGIFAHNPPKEPARGIEMYRGLLARYPSNLLIRFEILDMLMELNRFEDVVAESWLLEANSNEIMRTLARLWRARGLLYLGQTAEALLILNSIDPEPKEWPAWAGALVVLTRGQIFDAQGDREKARQHYRRLTGLAEDPRSLRIAGMAEAGLEHRFSSALPLQR